MLHTAAYWLMLSVRDAIPRSHAAGDRRIHHPAACACSRSPGASAETATRVRIAFAAACPQAALFRGIALSFQPAGP